MAASIVYNTAVAVLVALFFAMQVCAKPRPVRSVSDTDAGASAADAPNPLCVQTGHTYSQVYLFQQAVCEAQKDYRKLAQYLTSGHFEGLHPGPNCVPCRQFYDAQEDQIAWHKQLGYVSGVLNNIHNADYVRNMLKFETILNNTHNNGFLYIFDDMIKQTSTIDGFVRNLTTRIDGVDMQSLIGKDDVCGHPADPTWPPTQDDAESIEEYHYYLSVYNYGSMDALCDTLSQLHDVMQLALNGICPLNHHSHVVNTATPTARASTATDVHVTSPPSEKSTSPSDTNNV